MDLIGEFINSVTAKDRERAEFLLEAGVMINGKGPNGNTALLECCATYDDPDWLDFLLEKKGDVNIVNNQNDSPLTWAAFRGHANAVEWLVNNGANTDHLGHEGVTARVLAERKGFENIVAMLHDSNGEWKQSCLFRAASKGDMKKVEEMLAAGADVNTRQDNGNTPFIMAACNNNIPIMQTLFDHNADINIRNAQNDNAVCWTAFEGLREATVWLLERDADVDTKSFENKTPLMLAQEKNFPQIVKLIEDHIANRPADYVPPLVPKNPVKVFKSKPTSKDLFSAIKMGKVNEVKLCLEANVNVNQVGYNGNSPLLEACAQQDLVELLDLLLEFKADASINKRNFQNDTPLTWAAFEGHRATVDWLIAHGADATVRGYEKLTPQQLAESKSHTEISARLKEVDPTWRNNALFKAAKEKRIDDVKKHIEDGADVNAPEPSNGNTALIIAAWNNDVGMMDYLFEHGADIHIKNFQGDNAICWTSFDGKLEGTKWLLEHKADVHARSHENLTPLSLASQNGHEAVVNELQVFLTAEAKSNVHDEADPEPPVQQIPESLSDALSDMNITDDRKTLVSLVQEQKEEIKRLQEALVSPNKKPLATMPGPPELKRNPSQEDDSNACVTCLENPRTQVLVPCGHFALCKRCIDLLPRRMCPICRKDFVQAVTLFNS